MGFLGDLADQISSQFFLGENSNHSLDLVLDGQNLKYGTLGSFASQFDQSAERKYVEEGYLRRDPYVSDPKQFEVLMQEPSATVFIKKKMFSSIAENFRPDYMDQDEKLYYKSIKVLFANKCAQISALEKLSKIQAITSSSGSVTESLLPLIITAGDVITQGLTTGSSFFGISTSFGATSDSTKLVNVMDQLRKLYSFNTPAQNTTWLTDSSNIFQSQFGQGTGVIEITNFTNLTTNVSVDGIKNPGSFSLNIADPYEAMLITDWDIEKAISDATNMWKNSSLFQLLGEGGSDQVISDKQARLNQLRANRGASPITLKINPYTLLGKRVTAIFDRIGAELIFTYDSSGGTGIPGLGGIVGGAVQISDDYLLDGAVAGFDGLDTQPSPYGLGLDPFNPSVHINQAIPDNEKSVFEDLVTAIYSKIQLEGNSQSTFQTTNRATNYTRRKMRFNFSGKLIIQPMDTVHIYMRSKSIWDNKLLGGLNVAFNGFGLLQTINSLVTDIANIGALLNPSASLNIQAEKSAYVGSSFPDSLWMTLRSQFVGENEGMHVFAGLVDNASDSWSDGKFTISVTGRDNTIFFDQGKVNFKPGVDSFNGAIFDPLTPYKTNFDTISSNAKANTPQFLDENVAILGTSVDKKGLLKAKSGPDAGKKLASDHFMSDIVVDPSTGLQSRTLYAPDGLVYKWKEGIGVFVQFGSSFDMNDPNKTGNPSIYNEPFAGQDVMNVISLLITGQPYNYSNFWRAANSLYGFGRDPQSQQDSAHSYIQSLQNELVKSNTLWGNFIPFKNLVIDEQSFALAQQSQFRIAQRNNDLDQKIQKLQKLNQDAALFGAANVFGAPEVFQPQFDAVKAQLTSLQSSIQSTVDQISKDDDAFNSASAAAGADATYDYSDFVDSSKFSTSPSNPNVRRELRRQVNYLTRRMSYNVRANEDKNLFIVDDTYDKDYDILAYNQALTDGIKLYNNDFTSTREKITNTADLLNLEVFADTQGHVRVRPPQYNRMPSSVFYRMMYLKQAYGVQVFPQFLDDLFSTQIDSLRKRLEILEDLIRLDCAIALGQTANDDNAAIDFILTGGAGSNSGAIFSFLSDYTGAITDINQALHAADPDNSQSQKAGVDLVQTFIDTRALGTQATSTKTVFGNSTRYSAIITKLTQQVQDASGYSISNIPSFDANTYVDQLISRIQTKSGQKINKQDYIVNSAATGASVAIPINKVIDIFKVTAELQSKIQERQSVIRMFYSVLKNAIEYRYLDTDSVDAANQLTAPSVYGNSHIPEIFEHMIEDESYEEYGIGSGSRYIIKRAQIKSIQIAETPPDYTYVEVQGTFNTFAPNAVPQELNNFPQGGNGLVTAAAIDYDTWRNYGFKNQTSIKVPFLSDPNSQCAPYASMILSRARKNILKGTVTISGNEYQQPGEVVYLQDRGILFYVTAVRHNFGFGGSFTTTLDLSYGHAPGDYIPTTMDVIGKMIYNNRDTAQYTIQRQSSSGNENCLGVVQMSPNSTSLSASNTAQNSYSNFNQQTLNNILFTAAYLVNANNTAGNNVTANVELRVYYDDKTPADSALAAFATSAQQILIGKGDTGTGGGITISAGSAPQFKNQPFPEANCKVVSINLDDVNDRRSPSQQAIDAARNQVANNTITVSISIPGLGGGTPDTTTPPPENDKLRAALFGYIVDCWVTFTSTPLTAGT